MHPFAPSARVSCFGSSPHFFLRGLFARRGGPELELALTIPPLSPHAIPSPLPPCLSCLGATRLLRGHFRGWFKLCVGLGFGAPASIESHLIRIDSCSMLEPSGCEWSTFLGRSLKCYLMEGLGPKIAENRLKGIARNVFLRKRKKVKCLMHVLPIIFETLENKFFSFNSNMDKWV